MGKAYSDEMQQLPATMAWAAQQNIDLLRRAVLLYCDRGLLAVGSGGSFTAAAFAAELHLRVYGRPSQPMTPLESYQVPGAAATLAAGLLLSAEGKNPDILAAARQLQLRGCPSIGLTLRDASPLVDFCDETGAASLAMYEMPWGKDGYLATNSLVATLLLLWRAYSSDDAFQPAFESLLQWFDGLAAQLAGATAGASFGSRALILHGLAGRIGAIDLESKLTESALAFGQISNFRQFAHGRHLQLHKPPDPVTIVSLRSSSDPLADATLQLLPPSLGRVVDIALPTLGYAGTELASVLAVFLLTELWAGKDRDPGRPDVPQFGRDLHSLDVAHLVSEALPVSHAITRKCGDGDGASVVMAHAQDYIARLSGARFKALVCDFDGTFCDTVKRFGGLDTQIAPELSRLARGGVHLAFATGRGAKLAVVLREKLPEDVWPHVTLGCYSGSLIFRLDDKNVSNPMADSRLCELGRWLTESRALSAAIVPNPDAGQLSLRGVPGTEKVRLIAAINEWIAQQGLRGWRTFCSGHSVDVVTEQAGKLLVVEHVCQRLGLEADTQLLRLGDAGDFGGNDYELLSSGLSLSVESIPPGWSQCWNLLPRRLSGVRGTEHYLRGLVVQAGEARFTKDFMVQAEHNVREGLAAPDYG
ncbi:MAG TPA: hypothetical protein PLO41_03250 [Rubrivivax sp.]|nr:hypothetical protein [Rubrivivax sp.]